MCANARAYNRPGSQIVTDSYIIESVATGSMGSRTGGSALIYPLRCSEKGHSQECVFWHHFWWHFYHIQHFAAEKALKRRRRRRRARRRRMAVVRQ
jgi:hypothetical protein